MHALSTRGDGRPEQNPEDRLRTEIAATRYHNQAALDVADKLYFEALDRGFKAKHIVPQLTACATLLETAEMYIIEKLPPTPTPVTPNPMRDWEALELERLLNLYIDVYVDKDDAGLMKHTPTATEILDDLKLSLEQ